MIDRDGVTCDKCKTRESLEYVPFMGKINRIKAAGWNVTLVGRVWRHYCPTCRTPPPPPRQSAARYWWDE